MTFNTESDTPMYLLQLVCGSQTLMDYREEKFMKIYDLPKATEIAKKMFETYKDPHGNDFPQTYMNQVAVLATPARPTSKGNGEPIGLAPQVWKMTDVSADELSINPNTKGIEMNQNLKFAVQEYLEQMTTQEDDFVADVVESIQVDDFYDVAFWLSNERNNAEDPDTDVTDVDFEAVDEAELFAAVKSAIGKQTWQQVKQKYGASWRGTV